jgi:hypothetical protein
VQRADGVFELDHLEPGAYHLTATADAGRGEHDIALKAGEHAQITLELQPWARLRGLVIDGPHGCPDRGHVADGVSNRVVARPARCST